jgi:hypothetical protein
MEGIKYYNNLIDKLISEGNDYMISGITLL